MPPGEAYPIHSAACLGPMDEKVVEDLVDRIRTFGYSQAEPLLLLDGQVLDGRHRQEACRRLEITPPAVEIDLAGQDPHDYVLNRHHLRNPGTKERNIYAVEAFAPLGEGKRKIGARIGRVNAGGDLSVLLKAFRERPDIWSAYKDNNISQSELAVAVGAAPSGSSGMKHKIAVQQAEIAGRVSDIEMLEQENKELRASLARVRKLEVFDMRALRVLEQNVTSIDPSYEPLNLPVDDQLTTHAHVLQYSDLHAAERVSFEAMGGVNEYNWDIMLERHQRLARAIRSFKKNRPYPIDNLYVLGLGDMVTGDIHDELRETNEVVITEAAVRLGNDMAEFVATELVPLYKHIHFSGVVGNHGRTTGKPEFKAANKNWDWIAYKIMELRLAQFPSVTVTVPTSFETVVEVFDKKILCFHGDGIQSSMVGVPWGGIIRRTSEMFKARMAQGVYIDHFALGHWHEANVVSQRRIWVNGSIKGADEYGMKRHGGGQPPCQLLHTFHPTRGLVGTDYLVL